MSNKTQLSTNNTKLASLIQELTNKATGGGGAAVETCTVTVAFNSSAELLISYTAYESGVYEQKSEHIYNYGQTVTLSNVVCNTTIHVASTILYSMSYATAGAVEECGAPYFNKVFYATELFTCTDTSGGGITISEYAGGDDGGFA